MKNIWLFRTFLLLNVSLICALWKYPSTLLILLLGFSVFILMIERSPVILEIWIKAGVTGAILEIFITLLGVWSYQKSLFVGIPLWLPLFWGNIAIVIIKEFELHKKIEERNARRKPKGI